MVRELRFLISLWKVNLSSAMEYRVAFIAQSLGMILNDGMYFIIWIIFFDRFKDIRGWGLADMFITFGVSASAFGLVQTFFGNAFNLSEIISGGRLDYYLSLPRPTLLHVLASRLVPSGIGDLLYGFISYTASGLFSMNGLARFTLSILLASVVFLAFLVLVQSLAFWMGSSTGFSNLAVNAIVTFAIYPITLFNQTARLILFLVVPAAFMGAVPASFVRNFSWGTLGIMSLAALGFLSASILIFHIGLRRYESGSAIQSEV